MYITLQSIFEFVKCNTNSKNAVEGEEVLRAKQVVLCGKVQRVSYIYIYIKYYIVIIINYITSVNIQFENI